MKIPKSLIPARFYFENGFVEDGIVDVEPQEKLNVTYLPPGQPLFIETLCHLIGICDGCAIYVEGVE
jgi:hypothetical protein